MVFIFIMQTTPIPFGGYSQAGYPGTLISSSNSNFADKESRGRYEEHE